MRSGLPMHRRGLVVGMVAFAAVTLAACGGGGGESSSTTTSVAGGTIPSAFIAKVDAVCADAVPPHGQFPFQNFDPMHPDPGLLPKVGAFFEANIPTDQRVEIERELKALGEPTVDATEWDAIRALAIASEANAIKQVHAALASDASAFVATVNEAKRLHDQIGTKARAAGFANSSPCAKIF